MKSDTINLVLICIAYFAIGLLLAGNYIHDKTLKSMQDSVHNLIKIEMITEQQFNLLYDKVQDLENHGSRRITHIR
jgi:hypothetical protein